jgi:hypothetical protein
MIFTDKLRIIASVKKEKKQETRCWFSCSEDGEKKLMQTSFEIPRVEIFRVYSKLWSYFQTKMLQKLLLLVLIATVRCEDGKSGNLDALIDNVFSNDGRSDVVNEKVDKLDIAERS